MCLAVLCAGLACYQKNIASRRRPAPPPDYAVNLPLYQPPGEIQTPDCPQQTDSRGYRISGEKVIVSPRCLTVMNSRFGSRFNLDWHTADQTARSGTLGTLQDYDTNLTLLIQEGQNLRQAWPMLPNDRQPEITTELGLTNHTINLAYPDMVLSLTITAPFAPSRSAEDESAKMSAAPFFYLTLNLANRTGSTIRPTVKLSMGQADTADKQRETVYLHDPTSTGAVRALAAGKDQTVFLRQGAGGVSWTASLLPYGQSSTTLVYAGYHAHPVINDLSQEGENRALYFAYTRWFKHIDGVIDYARQNEADIRQQTADFEKNLDSFLLPREKWLAAQAFHAYLGNSWLVSDRQRTEPEYYVWEGEFKYLNTVDVAHDYAVLEGLYFPWVIKSALISWQNSAKKDEKGVVIPHDLGRKFALAPDQAYHIPGWETSGMPVEENLNYILLVYWYWFQTKDDRFVQGQSPFIQQLAESLIGRDTNHNGIADANIGMTTYDNDGNSALKEAPDSTYLGLKQLAAYLAAGQLFDVAQNEHGKQAVMQSARLITDALTKIYREKGFLPLSLDPDFTEKNQFGGQKVKAIDESGFAFVSGLFYPALTGLQSEMLEELKPILINSYQQAYHKSLVQDKKGKTIGLQLAENQSLALGWFSHSLIGETVAAKMLGLRYQSAELFFPRIYDTPYGFADGHYLHEEYPTPAALLFYPRGVTIFGKLVKDSAN